MWQARRELNLAVNSPVAIFQKIHLPDVPIKSAQVAGWLFKVKCANGQKSE